MPSIRSGSGYTVSRTSASYAAAAATPAAAPAAAASPSTATAPAAPSGSTPRRPKLEDQLGEDASQYKKVPDLIDEAFLEFLNFFLDDIDNAFVRNKYKLKAKDNGNDFIDIMLAEIKQDEVSMLVEDTTEEEMKLILEEGMREISWTEFTRVTGRYEEWNDTLDADAFVDDRKRAHRFRKMLNNLGTEVRTELSQEISRRVSIAAAKGHDIAKHDPLGLLTSAASVVLNDLEMKERSSAVSQGRALKLNRFDPNRKPASVSRQRARRRLDQAALQFLPSWEI